MLICKFKLFIEYELIQLKILCRFNTHLITLNYKKYRHPQYSSYLYYNLCSGKSLNFKYAKGKGSLTT